jgi:hypothetical protein
MDSFLDRMKVLLPVLGCDVLVPMQLVKAETLTCKIKSLRAQGQRTAKGFVVLKGSQAIPKVRAAAPEHGGWVINLRDKLREMSVLVPNGAHLVFVKDYEFKGPSAAAAVIRGGNANGLTEWKTKDGKTLKQIEEVI